MTKLLSEALQKVAELPDARQDDAAHILLALIDSDAKPYHLSDAELQEIEQAIADVVPDTLPRKKRSGISSNMRGHEAPLLASRATPLTSSRTCALVRTCLLVRS